MKHDYSDVMGGAKIMRPWFSGKLLEKLKMKNRHEYLGMYLPNRPILKNYRKFKNFSRVFSAFHKLSAKCYACET